MMSPELWDLYMAWMFSAILLGYGGPLFGILATGLGMWAAVGGATRHRILFSILAAPVVILGICLVMAAAWLFLPGLWAR